MRIGIPREVKVLEGRVGLIPAAAAELVKLGHQVYMEQGAAILSGYTDEDYIVLGIVILPDARTLYETVEMIIKVKEPQAQELEYLRSDHLLFCYLHLSAAPELMQALKQIGLTAVAFETVEESGGELPLLAPMSDIAGRIAVQVGTHLLHQPQGGRGILMGGVPATERGKVVILGAGVAGGNAARVAAAMGAEVTVFNRSRDKLAAMRDLGGNVTALYAYDDAIRQAVLEADLLIGAVLVTGARAPHLVSADTVKQMKAGSVIIDISVDQGGCIETTKPTTYAEPTFVWEDVVHFGVTNMPGAVPRTSSQALSAALIPYAMKLAEVGWEQAPALLKGVNLRARKVIHPALQ